MKQVVILILIFISGTVFALEDKVSFETTEQANIFKELTLELRCPKCQNQNIADSDAVVAKDLKEKVYQLVKQGESKQQVIDFMIDRYGYFVHYKPPVTLATLVLWILPILFVLLGFISIIFRQKKASKELTWSDHDEQKLNRLITKYQTSQTETKS